MFGMFRTYHSPQITQNFYYNRNTENRKNHTGSEQSEQPMTPTENSYSGNEFYSSNYNGYYNNFSNTPNTFSTEAEPTLYGFFHDLFNGVFNPEAKPFNPDEFYKEFMSIFDGSNTNSSNNDTEDNSTQNNDSQDNNNQKINDQNNSNNQRINDQNNNAQGSDVRNSNPRSLHCNYTQTGRFDFEIDNQRYAVAKNSNGSGEAAYRVNQNGSLGEMIDKAVQYGGSLGVDGFFEVGGINGISSNDRIYIGGTDRDKTIQILRATAKIDDTERFYGAAKQEKLYSIGTPINGSIVNSTD